MTTPALTPRPTPADPALTGYLLELAALGVRIAQVAADMAEIEGRVVATVATSLPPTMGDPRTLAEAPEAGLAVDGAAAQLAEALPRIASATQSFDRVARAVRRTAALIRRIEAGWPRRGAADDRRAMARRQVSRSVGETIVRHAQGEAAERLFDDLNDRLDTLELDDALMDQPVEVVIAAICRDLGLPEPGAQTGSPAAPAPGATRRVPDG